MLIWVFLTKGIKWLPISLINVGMLAATMIQGAAILGFWPALGFTVFGLAFIDFVVIGGVLGSFVFGDPHSYPLKWLFSYPVSEIVLKTHYGNSKNGVIAATNTKVHEMEQWCSENCKGKYIFCHAGFFTFMDKSEAMAFKLRWM